ncbi:MAG: hypothetical protein MJZ57_07395 [Bacteroidales bacterium]|nr:hypothetical protein [Bacteroidales bacterium]
MFSIIFAVLAYGTAKIKKNNLGEYSDLNFDVGIVYGNAFQYAAVVLGAMVGTEDER